MIIPALRWEDRVEGVQAAGGNGSKGARNSHKSSVSVWMLRCMLMPTRSLSGPNITDFVGVSPMRLGQEKMGPFFFKLRVAFSSQNITATHSPPALHAHKHFCVNSELLCSRKHYLRFACVQPKSYVKAEFLPP